MIELITGEQIEWDHLKNLNHGGISSLLDSHPAVLRQNPDLRSSYKYELINAILIKALIKEGAPSISVEQLVEERGDKWKTRVVS